MNGSEYLFVLLSEECAELSKQAAKALRFGAEDAEPGQDKNNIERIWEEFNDLMAVMNMLEELYVNISRVNRQLVNEKTEKIKKFMEYSRKQGTLR